MHVSSKYFKLKVHKFYGFLKCTSEVIERYILVHCCIVHYKHIFINFHDFMYHLFVTWFIVSTVCETLRLHFSQKLLWQDYSWRQICCSLMYSKLINFYSIAKWFPYYMVFEYYFSIYYPRDGKYKIHSTKSSAKAKS